MINEKAVSNNILNFIRNSQIITNKTNREFSSYFDMSEKTFSEIISGKRDISARNLIFGSETLDTSIESIINNKVDYLEIEKLFLGIFDELPERYANGAYGKKRSCINILNYIEMNHGIAIKALILRKFNLHLQDFSDPDEVINNHFIVDLVGYLYSNGFNDQDLIGMGEISYICNKDGMIGDTLKDYDNSEDLIEYFFENAVRDFDINYKYEILDLKNNSYTVGLTQIPEVLESMKVKKLGSLEVSLMKSGVIKSLPRYAGKPDFRVTLEKSIHRGDNYCAYKIDFSNKPSPGLNTANHDLIH